MASWLAGYRAPPGTTDELLDADGRPREHWLTFLGGLARHGEADIDQRFASANRRIDEMGVTYRAPGEARERFAPLARLPLLLPQAEWEAIEAGIIQRAELLDLILRDIYGEGRLIEDGALPATAVTGSPEFIRPMRGVAPPGGRWLRFYAAE
ncbi:MAG: circularly permuted type 2 ATP-grasp protein, partial [Methylocystis sp.]